jgi:hypothetical protein
LIPQFKIILVSWINSPEKSSELFDENRFNIDNPVIGLVDHLSESAPKDTQGQSPSQERDQPEIIT